MTEFSRTGKVLILSLALAAAVAGRVGAAPAAPGAPLPPPGKVELDPPRLLGARSVMALHMRRVIPDVVIVPDHGSYMHAIAAWTRERFWPVLIDDGAPATRDDIARFVRAFAPRRVVRWSIGGVAGSNATATRVAVEHALASAWGFEAPAGGPASFVRAAVAAGIPPAGVVVANADDPAWPAALALAAGRAQPIVWIETTVDFGGAYTAVEATALEGRIEALVTATGLGWETLGDQVDAVTLCLNAPSRIQTGPDAWLATTDCLGRTGIDDRERWAWFGQVPGDEPRAAYAAMSSLFLTPGSAWLFDGYPEEPPYTTWDATTAALPLRERGLAVTVFDAPAAGRRTWRTAAMQPIDAALVFVNTHGDRGDFNLQPGRATAGDIPLLAVPAAVYMVHSWSAANLASRRTVGGRWLERGAFAYFGSVQEPYLQAFVPTPVVTARLASGYPWGAAVRIEPRPPWKLATVGDPLFTAVPRPARVDEPLPLPGAEPLETTLRVALGEQRFAEVIDTLAMLGRDDDAAQLGVALRRDRPEQYTADVARRVVLPLFRTGRGREIPAAIEAIGFFHRRDRVLLDAMWLFGGPRAGALDAASVDTLRRHLRPDQIAVDALELVPAVRRGFGAASARQMLTAAVTQETSRRGRRDLERALQQLGP